MSYLTPHGRLTESGARYILQMRSLGWTYTKIAQTLGCTIGSVYNVCKRRTWAWL